MKGRVTKKWKSLPDSRKLYNMIKNDKLTYDEFGQICLTFSDDDYFYKEERYDVPKWLQILIEKEKEKSYEEGKMQKMRDIKMVLEIEESYCL